MVTIQLFAIPPSHTSTVRDAQHAASPLQATWRDVAVSAPGRNTAAAWSYHLRVRQRSSIGIAP